MYSPDYIICYTDDRGNNIWEGISGEDAMQERIFELTELYKVCTDDEVFVFDFTQQL